MKRPYHADKNALYTPANNALFFADGRPETDAELCAEMSRLAYLKFESGSTLQDQMKSILNKIGFDQYSFFNAGGTQGFCCSDGSKTLLSFRGTESDDPTDLVSDAFAIPLKWAGAGRVHAGFARALALVQDDVAAALANVETPLLITGHSLGAALATLAASLWRPGSLITFGSPRVGDSEFCASLDGVDVQRFVDCCDIVTRVPPELKLYEHAGRLFYIDADGNIIENPDTDKIDEDRVSARESYVMKYTFGKGNVAVRDLADHAPVNYVSAFSGRT
jgi:hypothetical protein